MRKKKGFTLIELLAAIVILAIISLIAIPIIINITKNSRKNAFKDSVYSLIRAVKYYYVMDADNQTDDDLVFTFGEFSNNGFNGSAGDSSDNLLEWSDHIEYITTNNPSFFVKDLIQTKNKKISDLIDDRYYDSTIYDSYEDYKKLMEEEIQQEIDELLASQLSSSDYNLADEIVKNTTSSEKQDIFDIINSELLVTGRQPDYGYIRINKNQGNKIDLKIAYDEFCYIKDIDSDDITVVEDLDQCGLIVYNQTYSETAEVEFTIDNEDEIANADWYNHNLKIRVKATSPEDDSINYIRYCKTSGDSCEPDQRVNDSMFLVDITDNGTTTICAYVVTKSDLVSETTCSMQYQIDKNPPTPGKNQNIR